MQVSRWVGAFGVVAVLAACGAGPRAVRQQEERERELARQAELEEEPYAIVGSHVLIAYLGAERADESVTRSKDEARVLAEEVLARAKAGEDFASLARELSDGPSAPDGGSLGGFTRGQMVPAFSDAAFSLEPGQLYDGVVETGFGFHVIRRDK